MKISNSNSFKREFNYVRFLGLLEDISKNNKDIEIIEGTQRNTNKITIIYDKTIVKATIHLYSQYFDVVLWENHNVKDAYRLKYSDSYIDIFLEIMKTLVKDIQEINKQKKIKKIKLRKILSRR